jgi:beta-N-acetylhexosaminidase
MRVVLLVLAIAVAGCGNLGVDPITGLPAGQLASPAPQEPPDIRGTLTAVESGTQGQGGLLTIEEDPNVPSGSAKARVRLTGQTNLLRANGQRLGFTEFKVGQRVEAWFEGPVAESYPVQATARAVRVVE